jgi:hypothetical protein
LAVDELKNKPTLDSKDAWLIAREVLELAYSLEIIEGDKETQKDETISKLFTEIQDSLTKREQFLTSELRKIVTVRYVERIAKVLSDFTEDTITEKEAKHRIFTILSGTFDENFIPEDLPLPTKIQITEQRGPQEAAAIYIDNLKIISRSTFYNYQRALKNEKINAAFMGTSLLVHRDFETFKKTVLNRILTAKKYFSI